MNILDHRVGRRPLAPPGGLALLAILGVLGLAGHSERAFATLSKGCDFPALKACQESQDFAPPIPAHSSVSAAFAPIRPCLPGVTGTVPNLVQESFVGPRACSELDRQADLVAALILNKYLHYRESLTSP